MACRFLFLPGRSSQGIFTLMTTAAFDRGASNIMLETSLELYRDLSVALRGLIARLKADAGVTAGAAKESGKELESALATHRKTLQTVLDLEASVGKRKQAWVDGASELDLDAARAEIAQRLAVWLAER